MTQAQAQDFACSGFGEHKNPFGSAAHDAPTHEAVTIADAVRRCRWIAVDINAASFGLYFVAPSMERARLVPCFDSDFPRVSLATKFVSGNNGEELVRHARASTQPRWWSANPGTKSSALFETLDWAARIQPLVPDSSGIAFPVYADRSHCGAVVFFGHDIMLAPEQLHEIHARCFALFAAVAAIRPGSSGKVPSVSKRELECLKLTANGYTSEEIAKLLKLSVHTANQYLTNTAHKLNAVNRMQAVAKALRLGLIE
ncbi:helix-turn-helix transcriptional regulator [Pseudaminobacter arsenicus]|uniref:Helix-turn-helix transcriptional regulator n=1 Tax=Borborobacter arsenicus TaxID=1851146 RepID=A0A432V5Y0_9HYPH|nr:helix-turn-helix transcriptional regulator [Pseudaminobacter arsenicus]RUM97561.1 helix-turn-helix transcriptional regulator [Pseudaminobacter arsenicus]